MIQLQVCFEHAVVGGMTRTPLVGRGCSLANWWIRGHRRWQRRLRGWRQRRWPQARNISRNPRFAEKWKCRRYIEPGKYAVFRGEHFHGGLIGGNVSEVVARLGLGCEKWVIFETGRGNVGQRPESRSPHAERDLGRDKPSNLPGRSAAGERLVHCWFLTASGTYLRTPTLTDLYGGLTS